MLLKAFWGCLKEVSKEIFETFALHCFWTLTRETYRNRTMPYTNHWREASQTITRKYARTLLQDYCVQKGSTQQRKSISNDEVLLAQIVVRLSRIDWHKLSTLGYNEIEMKFILSWHRAEEYNFNGKHFGHAHFSCRDRNFRSCLA